VLYTLLKPFSLFGLNIFYRISIKGLDTLPYDVPVIFAPNHTNGFVDPVILAMHSRKKVRFFARGDAFKGKFAKWLLNQMNVSPMYRLQEGYAELKKNDKSFEECKRLLAENKMILIFPEGICIQERRLHTLKKGLTRIAFQTLESLDYEKDIFIIPVGINYLAPTRFRSKVFIEIGEPVSIKAYEEKFKEDKVKAINDFTKHLEAKMSQHVSHINNPDHDRLVANIEEVFTHRLLKEKGLDPRKLKNHSIASSDIMRMVNALEIHKPEFISSLKDKLENYIQNINNNKLRNHLFHEESINKMNFGTFLVEYAVIYLGMPLYLIGLLLNYPPYYIGKIYADKKVKKAEFYASFRANLSFIFWTLYFLIQLIVIGIIFNNWMLLSVYAVTVIVSGVFVIKFYPAMKKIFGRWRLLRMVRKDRGTIEQLVNERAEVMNDLLLMKKEYNLISKK
jgi:glycerol-3-phosphate O-acyltransferase / dihydroxyacetone phosphate acyltransferase